MRHRYMRGSRPGAGRRALRMMCCAPLAIIAALLFTTHPDHVSAQESPATHALVELLAGYELGPSAAAIPIFDRAPDCGLFEHGTHHASGGGVGGLVPLSSNPALGIEVRFGVVTGTTRLTAEPHEPLYLGKQSDGKIVSVNHEYRLEDSWTAARLDLGVRWRIGTTVSLGAGLWFGQRFQSEITQKDALINEPDVRFAGGLLEQPMPERTLLSPTTSAFGVVADARYHLRLSDHLTAAPELQVRSDFAGMVRDYDWHSLLGVRLGIVFLIDFAHHDIPEPPAPPIIRDTVLLHVPFDAPTVRTSRLHASLELYGVDEDGHRLPAATIRVFEALKRQRASLLDAIYFDRGSSQLPERYRRLTGTVASAFTPDSLADLDPMAMHYQALNVIGWRMAHHAPASLTLSGSISTGESPALAHERVEAVRAYLHDVWHIDAARLTAADGAARQLPDRDEDQRAENRRVMFTANDPAILDPLITSTIARDYEPPLIALNPQFESDAGIRKWSVVLEHDGHEVGRLSNQDTGTATLNMSWQIDENRRDLTNSYLTAELSVEDSLGVVATTRTQVPLMIERNLRIVDRDEQHSGREVVTYSLLAFSTNSAEVNQRNRAILSSVVAGLRNGARVSVVGYADRTGTDRGNVSLSRRRADAVAQMLKTMLKNSSGRGAAISVVAGGYEAGRFDNGLPEGRVLSREVDVIIDQPARADHR